MLEVGRGKEFTLIVNIVGLGYVGLSLATVLTNAGVRVIGVEADARRRAQLRKDYSLSNFSVGISPAHEAEATIFCIQTPVAPNGSANLSALLKAIREVVPLLSKKALIVVESTVGVGDNLGILVPIISSYMGEPGLDFFYAYAPERVSPAQDEPQYRDIPRIVAGVTSQCLAKAIFFYSRFFPTVIDSQNVVDVEMAKLLENTFRLVNISLVNEIARYEDELGFSMQAVTALAATKPFGFLGFYPSAGAGGHCIPVDPCYLSYGVNKAGGELRLLDSALQINSETPLWIAEKAATLASSTRRHILICGVAYKQGVADLRNSPALSVISELLRKGFEICYCDPLVDRLRVNNAEIAKHRKGHCIPAVVVALHSSGVLSDLELDQTCKRIILDPSEENLFSHASVFLPDEGASE